MPASGPPELLTIPDNPAGQPLMLTSCLDARPPDRYPVRSSPVIHSSQGAMPLWLDHRLLLATDDVNTLSPAEIANCIRKSTDGNPAHRLVTRILAEDAPDQDNVTAVPVAAEDLPPNIADPGARAGGNVAF